MEIPERWGVLAGIPSVVGVWIFSGTAQYGRRFFGLEHQINILFHFFIILQVNKNTLMHTVQLLMHDSKLNMAAVTSYENTLNLRW